MWAVALLWVGALAAWACWVQAQTGRGADGKIAGRGLSPRERLVFLLLLVPPMASWGRSRLPPARPLQVIEERVHKKPLAR